MSVDTAHGAFVFTEHGGMWRRWEEYCSWQNSDTKDGRMWRWQRISPLAGLKMHHGGLWRSGLSFWWDSNLQLPDPKSSFVRTCTTITEKMKESTFKYLHLSYNT